MPIHADGVAVREAEELRDSVRIEELVDVYLSAHTIRLLQYSDPSEASIRLQ